jgi:hypothetical protein
MRRHSEGELMDESDDIGAAIRAAVATVRAPEPLRARVTAERRTARRRLWRRDGLIGAAVAVAAATAAALVLVLPGGGPTVGDAAVASLREPTAPAPAPLPGTKLLGARVGPVAFPNWGIDQGWRAVGQRAGHIDGRAARTVVYEDDAGRRLGYTIVDGEPLDVPDGELRRRNGTAVTVVDEGGATVATWRRHGHTCVLAAEDVPPEALVRLASWNAY